MLNNPFSHIDSVKPFLAMEISARAHELKNKGKDIIHLEFGEPEFATPKVISDAAIKAIGQKQTKYTHTQGVEKFRMAVIEKYHAKFGVRLSTNQVLTSSGSSPLLFLAIRMLVEQDMELIITDPCYSCYENLAKIAGVKTIRIPLRLEDGFQLDIDCLKKHITKKTRAILINSPMNPTGITLSDESFRNLAALGIPIISDEIYGDLIYEGKPRSILNFTDNAIVVNGLSKYYAMTGWRLGYMILPENWVAVASRIHQNLMISAAHFIQIAGTAALRSAEKECDANRLKLNAKRLFLIRRLKECGLDPGYLPTGAFYVFFRYPNQQMTSLDTAIDILEKQGVALTPGIDFGPAGEGFLRFSYSNSMENISEAVNRIQRYFFP